MSDDCEDSTGLACIWWIIIGIILVCVFGVVLILVCFVRVKMVKAQAKKAARDSNAAPTAVLEVKLESPEAKVNEEQRPLTPKAPVSPKRPPPTKKPAGKATYVYIGPHHRLTLYTTEKHTVRHVIDQTNLALEEYDGWDQSFAIVALSSRPALVDHLEHFPADVLTDLEDDEDDHDAEWRPPILELLAINHDHLPLTDYDKHTAMFADVPGSPRAGEDYWSGVGCHVWEFWEGKNPKTLV